MIISIQSFFVFVVVSYAVVLVPFLDAGFRNYLVLFAAFSGVLSLLFFRVQAGGALVWALIMVVYMTLVALGASGFSGLGSVALTFLYMMGYFTVASIAKRPWFDAPFATTLLGRIVIAFAIVSVLQMLASFTGLPNPNLISSKGLWSYNSLAFEPSHLGRGVGITMLAYLILMPQQPGTHVSFISGPRNRKVLLAFFVTMLLSGSALAAIAIPVTLLFALQPRWSVPLIGVAFLGWPLLLSLDFEPMQRALLLVSNLHTFDIEQLFEADASGAIRVAPMLVYLDIADPGVWAFWLGYGAEGSDSFFIGQVQGIRDFDGGVGFLPGFLTTYGVVGFALFVWGFLMRTWNGRTFPIVLFWLVFFTSVPWNTQLFWYGLIVLVLVDDAYPKRSGNLRDSSTQEFTTRHAGFV